MTTVAWDGTTLAADSQMTEGNLMLSTTKLFKIPLGRKWGAGARAIVGYTGMISTSMQVIGWLADIVMKDCKVTDGRMSPIDRFGVPYSDPSMVPKIIKTETPEDTEYSIILITPFEAIIFDSSADFVASRIDNEVYAIGSGAQFAFGALYAGHNAVEAVRVASRLDIYTDDKIIFLKQEKGAEDD